MNSSISDHKQVFLLVNHRVNVGNTQCPRPLNCSTRYASCSGQTLCLPHRRSSVSRIRRFILFHNERHPRPETQTPPHGILMVRLLCTLIHL